MNSKHHAAASGLHNQSELKHRKPPNFGLSPSDLTQSICSSISYWASASFRLRLNPKHCAKNWRYTNTQGFRKGLLVAWLYLQRTMEGQWAMYFAFAFWLVHIALLRETTCFVSKTCIVPLHCFTLASRHLQACRSSICKTQETKTWWTWSFSCFCVKQAGHRMSQHVTTDTSDGFEDIASVSEGL